MIQYMVLSSLDKKRTVISVHRSEEQGADPSKSFIRMQRYRRNSAKKWQCLRMKTAFSGQKALAPIAGQLFTGTQNGFW